MRNVLSGIVIVLGALANGANANTVNNSVLPAESTVYEVNARPFDGYKGATLFEDVDFVQGSAGVVNNLGPVDAGWYQLTLTDFVFPNAFEDLRVALTTATGVVSMLNLSDGYEQAANFIQLNDSDSYYLSIYGITTAGSYALYGVELSHFIASPVPLPASIFLLFTGLMAWGATSIKRKSVV